MPWVVCLLRQEGVEADPLACTVDIHSRVRVVESLGVDQRGVEAVWHVVFGA
jgi:hypothetical protein